MGLILLEFLNFVSNSVLNTVLTPSPTVLTVCEHLLLGRCSRVLTPVLVCVTVTSIPKLVCER